MNLKINIVPLLKGEDKKVIKSERIRLGEIDEKGQLYVNGFSGSKLTLPISLRQELRKPFGKITKDVKSIKRIENTFLISVGDITAINLAKINVNPDIRIIDFKTERKKINKNLISVNKSSIQCIFMDFRSLMEDLATSIIGFKEIIRQKRNLYVTSFLKTAVIYLGIFSLKGKYKKTVLSFQLAKEIYEGISET